jgi:hypothetical protein
MNRMEWEGEAGTRRETVPEIGVMAAAANSVGFHLNFEP